MPHGRHFGGNKYRNRRIKNNIDNRSRKNTVFSSVSELIINFIIKDISNNNSRIRSFFRKLLQNTKNEINQKRKVIKAKFTILNDNQKIESKKGDLNEKESSSTNT